MKKLINVKLSFNDNIKNIDITKNKRRKQENSGITLIALVITIIILLILATISLRLILGNGGLINQATEAKEETLKQEATEKINLKITKTQMNTYAEKQVMPTLQELADALCEDNEIEYVETESKKTGSLEKIEIGENDSIFTKLKSYSYEFEINSSLQLASINGIKIATEGSSNFIAPNYKNLIDITQHNSSANQYTATENGYIMMPSIAVISGTNIQVYIDDVLIAYVGNVNGAYIRQNILLPIAKNSTVYWKVHSGSVGANPPSMYFVPCN